MFGTRRDTPSWVTPGVAADTGRCTQLLMSGRFEVDLLLSLACSPSYPLEYFVLAPIMTAGCSGFGRRLRRFIHATMDECLASYRIVRCMLLSFLVPVRACGRA